MDKDKATKKFSITIDGKAFGEMSLSHTDSLYKGTVLYKEKEVKMLNVGGLGTQGGVKKFETANASEEVVVKKINDWLNGSFGKHKVVKIVAI